MRNFLLIIVLQLLTLSTYSQQAYQRGDKQINFGLNLAQGLGVYASFEDAIMDNISVGLEFGFGVNNANFSVTSTTYYQSNLRFSANAHYHFAQLIGVKENWDLYGGLDIGYSFWTKGKTLPTNEDYNWYKNTFLLGINGRARWFWNEQWGVNLEIGAGLGYYVFKTGVTVKLN